MHAPEGSIVVPLDGSRNAEHAVPWAAQLARLLHAPVAFVHIPEGEHLQSEADFARAREAFADYATSLARTQQLDSTRVSATVVPGAPAAAIVSYARSARAVAIATHGRGGFRAAIIGSVADKVVRGARCPVLLVPLEADLLPLDRHPILVALDGSAAAEAGLELAREVARGAAAEVVLVRAYTVPPPVGVEFFFYPADVTTALQEAAREYLDATARPGERTLAVVGAPDAAINATATELDAALVVMTSHGKGLAGRLALGSTTDRVMHSLRRPLLIVPVAAATEDSPT
ncbi:MAG: universal stress protein [Dehalococcoidia bacterium]|nr:universal stress protein [Dehalococcoidia bacterium]